MTRAIQGNLRRSVLMLAIPVVSRMFLQMLVGVVDLAMVGRVSSAATSAVGLGNQIYMLTGSLLMAFTVGATALVARMVGAGNNDYAKLYARQAITVTFLTGMAIGSFLFLTAENIMRFMLIASETPDPEIIRLGVTYLRVIALAEPLTFTMVTCHAVLQGAGNMKTPLYIMTISNVIHLILDYLLIFGIGFFPQMGVAGAALATSISKNLAAILSLIYLFSRRSPLRLSLKESFLPDWARIREIMSIGLPAAGEQFIRSSGNFVFSMLVAGMGSVVIAANQIIIKAMSITFQPGTGFGHAATTLVGQNLGAEQVGRAERSGYIASNIAAVSMSVVGIGMIAFSQQIAGFFTPDLAVQQAAADNLILLAIAQPFISYVLVMAGALRGAGDTKIVMWVTLIGTWGGRVVIAWFLGIYLGLGLKGVWSAVVLDNIARAILLVLRYRSGRWKSIQVRTVASTT
jgi:putative MATE family efflux protein